MVKLNKIYTRTGDSGETSLVTGERVGKHAPRIAAVGDIDETNAAIGVARAAFVTALAAHGGDTARLLLMLDRVQHDLFDLGADVATPLASGAGQGEDKALRITSQQVERLEREIDLVNEQLDPLRSFVLPGGTPAAASLHLARTVCRRAERTLCALAEAEPGTVNQQARNYVNRLSDLLFVMARAANRNGAIDHLWTPGKNR
jgi:cob(I)alamin adenosyltransferase